MLHIQKAPLGESLYRPARYSDRNPIFTGDEDLRRVLFQLIERVRSGNHNAARNAASLLVHIVSFMVFFSFPENARRMKITREIRQALITGISNPIRSILVDCEAEDADGSLVLEDSVLHYTAWLVVFCLENPLYFCLVENRTEYVKMLSIALRQLERLRPNTAWLDRLETAIEKQLA